MTVLTPAAFFALATVCAPGLDARMLLVQAQMESRLDTTIVHENKNGTRDWGLMQINDANWSLLGIHTSSEALDPCRNLRAAADLYHTLSRYNSGNATSSLDYAKAIITGTHDNPIQQPAPNSKSTTPIVYIRPAHAVRDLVYPTN